MFVEAEPGGERTRHSSRRSSTTRKSVIISRLDKAAILWSIHNRQITFIDDFNFDLIREDFVSLRGSDRLQLATRTVIDKVFDDKDSIVSNEALKTYLPKFKDQVTLKVILFYTI